MAHEKVIFHYSHQINKLTSILWSRDGCYSVWLIAGRTDVGNTRYGKRLEVLIVQFTCIMMLYTKW